MNDLNLLRWNDPILQNNRKNKPLAIIATGPSYEQIKPGLFDGITVFAVNAAITEFYKRKDVFWICHDMHKILKQGIKKKIPGYKHWKLVTRRVYIPGNFGNVPWAAVGWVPGKGPFPFKIDRKDAERATIYWYADLDDQEGFCLRSETAVQVALEVGCFWGFSPIYLVGVDMGHQENRAYAKIWAWKHCKIKPLKFEKMKQSFFKWRPRWIEDIYTLSPYWSGPFTPISSTDIRLREHQKLPSRGFEATP
jgi:hypothetical protein